LAKQRIDLEKEVQTALDAFARKNVDRAKNVSNAQLDIYAKTYNEMLKMESNYTAKKKSTPAKIKSEFGDLASIGNIDENYKFVTKIDDSFKKLKAKQDALTKKFDADMAKAMSPDKKESLTNKYIVDNMKLQEDYFKASITGSKNAIAELKKQLKDSTLTDDQENKIKQQIDAYEKDIISSQNSIKDTIKERFDFEFSLLDEAMKKYEKFNSELDYVMSIVDALGGDNGEAKGVLLNEMMSVEKSRNSELSKTLNSLRSQRDLYEKGSHEWQIINSEVEQYNKLLQDSNKELLQMNKSIMNSTS
jgi:hypothetical protein